MANLTRFRHNTIFYKRKYLLNAKKITNFASIRDMLFPFIKIAIMEKTIKEFTEALENCENIYKSKTGDYGPSWRVLRPETLTDQLLIKTRRIRQIETSGTTAVGEGILPEYKALVNYGIMAIIQLRHGVADSKDMETSEALAEYRKIAKETMQLMIKKNTDYGEAWRDMRVSSYTDLILAKLERIKEIENNNGKTSVSEGIESNYFDIINYAVFGIIRLT